jgi:hypothetical protein
VKKKDTSSTTGDFGRHLDALGELFSLTGDREFAIQKLTYYQNHVRRDSGASHIDPKKKHPQSTPASTTTSAPLTANSIIRRDN